MTETERAWLRILRLSVALKYIHARMGAFHSTRKDSVLNLSEIPGDEFEKIFSPGTFFLFDFLSGSFG